jgi:pimeloyl-ACP methyl ester carboxylesterase
VAWSPCREGFQCAALTVPLDYDAPSGANISLALIRLRAAAPRQRIGTLVLNPGGPGGSGVDLVRGVGELLPLELRARFDIVGFDPRGVLRSTPLRCYDTWDHATGALPRATFPVTAREERVQQVYVTKLAAACRRRGGPILGHMSTRDVARDMDVLRAALGQRQLTYLGYSYGSILGLTYANMFPRRVRALVIDGVVDPRTWAGRGRTDTLDPVGTRLRSDVGAQRTLKEFFRLCDQAGPNCAFSGGAQRRFAKLAARLRAHPITDPEGTWTFADQISVTLGALYSTTAWPDLANFLAVVEADLKPKVRLQRLAAIRTRLGVSAQAQENYPNEVEAGPGVTCSDTRKPSTLASWQRAATRSERLHGYFGRLWTWVGSQCLAWPRLAGQDRYTGGWTARTPNPVLVLGNYFDPATRYGGAVAAAHLLPNARLFTYAGWGHTAFLSAGNYCVDRAVTTYLLTARAPRPGSVCRPEGSPFGPGMSRARPVGGAAAAVTASTLPSSVRRALLHR